MMRASRRAVLALACALVLCCAPLLVASRPVARRHHHEEEAHARRPAHPSSSAHANAPARLLRADAAPAEDFEAAHSCLMMPTAGTSTRDPQGRLWGVRNGARCAFKDHAGHALFFVGYEPGDWLHTPACSMPPFPDSSVADAKLKVWAWESDGSLCAFKDDRQQPAPMIQDFRLQMLSWREAPACTINPKPTANNSVPDAHGCLWGFQLDRNCAFKNVSLGAGKPVAVYYEGYTGACNVMASELQAAEQNVVNSLQKEDEPVALIASVASTEPEDTGANSTTTSDTPGAFTALQGVVGQKSTGEEVRQEAALSTPAMFTDLGVIGQRAREQGGATVTAAGSEDSSAPSAVSTVLVDFGDGPSLRSSLGTQRRRLSEQVLDPRFPKAAPTSNCRRGLNTITSPRHGSRGAAHTDGCLPEARASAEPVIAAAEGPAVTHKPVAFVPDSDKTGPGGFSPPVSHGRSGVDFGAGPAVSKADAVQAAELSGAAIPNVFSPGAFPGHAFDSLRLPQAAAPQDSSRRHLQQAVAVARAVATSSGHGQKTSASATAVAHHNSSALAMSHASNNGSANATAIATGGHHASAVVVASPRSNTTSCILSVTVVNNKVSWHCADPPVSSPPAPAADGSANATVTSEGPSPAPAPANDATPSADNLAQTWQAAEPCASTPNKTNSVQDAEGRLWGYEQQRPCAYRGTDGAPLLFPGYIAVKWSTAPACASDAPTATNSMSDAEGRLWGWDFHGDGLCAFKDPSSGEPILFSAPAPAGPVAQADLAPQLSPSAAGPSNATNASAPASPGAGLGDARDNSSLALAADAQAQAITSSLSPNATREEVALAAAQTAIIYQRASEADAVAKSSDVGGSGSGNSSVVTVSEEANTDIAQQLPPVLLAALSQPRAHCV